MPSQSQQCHTSAHAQQGHDHVNRISHRVPVGITFANKNNFASLDISDDDEMIDVSDYYSNDIDNDDDPSKAADPEAADHEDYVKTTGMDEQ